MKSAAKIIESRCNALARLILAKDSIARARRDAAYVVANVKSRSDPVFHAFECAVVVCYARPFVSSDSGRISERYERFPQRPELRPLHKCLIDTRHAFVAHQCLTKHRVSVIKPGGTLERPEGILGFIAGGELIESLSIKPAIFKNIVELCEFQLERIEADIEKEAVEIQKLNDNAR